MRVLGIDTSLRSTGAAVVESRGSSMTALEQTVLRAAPSRLLSACLRTIAEGLDELISRHNPDAAAIEGVFYCKNARTAVILGQARGAAIFACSRRGVPVYEYAPRKVKQAIVGNGAAEKAQVRKMAMRLLALNIVPQEDAGDALALAICHLHNASGHRLLAPSEI